MRRPAIGLLLAFVLAACDRETAIVVEVTWDPAALDSTADTLRIYVGTPTAEPGAFATGTGTKAIPLAGLVPPYRYLLHPGGDLDAIGAVQIAAALTAGDLGRPIAFAPAPAPIAFVEGEIRTIVLAPTARPFDVSGPALECVVWANDGVRDLDRAIGTDGNNDCDRSANELDCQPFNPRIDGTNADGDPAACDDCLDGTAPVDLGGWSIAPGSVFPGQTESAFREANGIPDNVVCVHIDYDCTGACEDDNGGNGDADLSGTGRCGKLSFGAQAGVCSFTPADCDESRAGDTPVFGDPEVCDGADESCDKRFAPNLPCPLPGPAGACGAGVQTCDDGRGVFDSCEPAGFPHSLDIDTCSVLANVDGCRFDDDPLQCAGGDRGTCVVGVGGPGCGEERVRLPGVTGQVGCDWHVIGGVDHAEWIIGFENPSDPQGPPVESTIACAPLLVARSAHPNPTRRTVLILGAPTVGGDAGVARFVRFEASEATVDCDGVLACSPILVEN